MKLTAIVAASGLLLTGLLAFTPTATACAQGAPICDIVYECPAEPAVKAAVCVVVNGGEVVCAVVQRVIC
jgi:hypothetical protein